MGLPPGTSLALSPLRKVMCDLLHFSRQVPLVAIERRMPLGRVIEARQRLAARPSWFAIFLKAYALVAQERAELRRSYLSFPWPRLHQHDCNVAQLAVARVVAAEEGVLTLKVRHPERLSLADLDTLIRRARTEPVESFGDFRRLLLLGRLPQPLRRLAWWAGLQVSARWRQRYAGTFGITGVAALGSTSLHLLSPLTTTLTYGVFMEDGSVLARLFYDHRVLDGVQPAEALRDLEQALRGPILHELQATSQHAA